MSHSISSSQNKLYGLDHLRALAITIVFFFHYQLPFFAHPDWLPPIAKFGWTGVDLFFVLSGFLISSQLFEQIKNGERISFTRFFIKRCFRILPAYWFVVALYFCLPWFHEREALPPLWKFLTFTQNLGLDLRTSGTFSHAWSLCVEEHFYLFLPLILIALQTSGLIKKAGWLLPVLFFLCVAARWFNWHHFYYPHLNADDASTTWYQYIYYPTYTRLDGLLAGVTIAFIYCFLPEKWNVISSYGNWFIVAGIFVLLICGLLFTDQESLPSTIFCFAFVAAGFGLITTTAVSKQSVLYKWHSKATSFLARLSYAVYLLHKGVIHITQTVLSQLGMDTKSALTMLCCIATCLISAWLVNLIIEKPFLNLRYGALAMLK